MLDAAASESITVRQLLSHTGGFDGDLFEDTGRGDDAVAKLVAFVRSNARQVSGPGELFSYCNHVPGCGRARRRAGGHAAAFIDEVLAEILSSAAGIRWEGRRREDQECLASVQR